MSNVLIGIIGVVLFIGLALAGALILGSDFQIATRDSKVAAIMAGMQQVSQALDMYALKTGNVFPAQTDINSSGLLVPRFMKSLYKDPEGGGQPIIYVFNGQRYLILGGLSTPNCAGIQRNLTGSETITTFSSSSGTPPAGTNGCANMDGTNLIVYVRI